MKNYYKILEVSEKASSDEIKRSYRKLAFKYHPDKSTYSGADRLFQEINEAYGVLGNSESRALYDLERRPAPRPTYTTTGTRTNYQRRPAPPRFTRRPPPSIGPYAKYFTGFSKFTFICAVIIAMDFVLPEMGDIREVRSKRYDPYYEIYELRIGNSSFFIDEPEAKYIHPNQQVVLVYTPLFGKLLGLRCLINGNEVVFRYKKSIYYNLSFALIILLITGYIGGFQVRGQESVLNFFVVNGILIILVWVFFNIS